MKKITIISWLVILITIIFHCISRKKWMDYAEKRYREGYMEADEELRKEIRNRMNKI